MKLHPRLSRAAVELVSRFETFHPVARPAAGGGWTVGYGHTLTAREGVEVSRADAEALLLFDLSRAAQAVEAALFAPAAPRQFEALTAFCFNIGAENFRTSSALARFNAGAELEAADEIERWRQAELGAGTQVVDALVRRRAAEKAHFLGLPEGFSKSPSAVLRPVAGGDPSTVDAAPAAEPRSATLAAADGIQARLRALVPEPPAPPVAEDEPEAPPFPEAQEEAEAPSSLAGAEDRPTETLAETPPSPSAPPAEPPPLETAPQAQAAGAAPTPYVAPPPPPPPPERALPPANDVQPEPAPEVPPALMQDEPSPSSPASRPPFAGLRLEERGMYAVLAALGACLFVAAAVLILGGRPDLSSLLLGMVGALMLTPGVYGLLGPARRRG
jgi:lysozyme